ncbi:CBS domain-containing protein [Marinomonas agarivorans]|nr:CBS domain-containing protein [Marinomonas agarivorans]
MKVSDIMVRDPVCVDMDTRLPEIRKLFCENYFHHLPVIDHGRLVGIISDRDVLRVLSPFLDTPAAMERDQETLNRAAHQVMTRQPITVKENDTIEKVLKWLDKVDISSVLVVNDNQEVIGIVTWRDLVRHAKFN